jgi:FHS family L-fucose permease-like MFS transporter
LLALVFAVFFLFGAAASLNDLLNPKLKALFALPYVEAMLVQFAFFASYGVCSIPAGLMMSRVGYVRGVALGLALMAGGCLLFIPAARFGLLPIFLTAVCLIGAGATVLEVAANPLAIALGPPETAHSRLTFAQFFNALGVFVTVRFGAHVILGGRASADPGAISRVYLVLAAVVALVAGVLWTRRGALDRQNAQAARFAGSLALLRRPRLAFGAVCIFVYVGAEVSIASLMVNYLGDHRVLSLAPKAAGFLLSYYWLGALFGRMAGALLLRRARAGWLLALFAATALALVTISANASGWVAAAALIAVGLCNSIQFPTIFSLASEGLGEAAPQASGLLCAAIIGGAVIPELAGATADRFGLAAALAAPALCYLIIAVFGLYTVRKPARFPP